MIERAIYTYKPLKDRAIGFLNEDKLWGFANESFTESLNQFGEVVIYCPNEEVTHLNSVVMSGVQVVGLNYSNYTEFDPRFTNFPKAISNYISSVVDGKKSIHLDLDFKFVQPLTTQQLEADVLCENVRAEYYPLNTITRRMATHILHKINPNYIPSSSVVYFKDKNLVNEFYQEKGEFCKIDWENNEPINEKEIILSEEHTISYLALKNELEITGLNKEQYIHLYGRKKLMY